MSMRAKAVAGMIGSLSLCFALQAQDEKFLDFKIASGVAADGGILYHDDKPARVDIGDTAAIADLLRDRESGSVKDMDPALLDLLHDLKTELEQKKPGLDVVFHVISGYRSNATNENLRNDPDNPYRSSVAKHSQHSAGSAIDIFVPGLKGTELRDTAWCLQKGSVGAYPAEYFPLPYIHLDTRGSEDGERRRYWGFEPPRCEGE